MTEAVPTLWTSSGMRSCWGSYGASMLQPCDDACGLWSSCGASLGPGNGASLGPSNGAFTLVHFDTIPESYHIESLNTVQSEDPIA